MPSPKTNRLNRADPGNGDSEKLLRRMARRFMANWKQEYDGPTTLAEATACNLNHDEWLDDETHWIWDFALRYAD